MVIDRMQDILCPGWLVNNQTRRESSSSSDAYYSSLTDHKSKKELVFALKGIPVYWKKHHVIDNTTLA